MSTLVIVRPRFLARLAVLAGALTIGSLAAPEALAQEVGWPQSYSLRWYGQNFYDHQHIGLFGPHGVRRQYRVGYYGPAMLYGRQYSDQSGLTSTRPFAPSRTIGEGPGYGGNSAPY